MSHTGAASEPGDVGSVGEEAAKLLGALAGWAREQAVGDALTDFVEHAADPAEAHEHLATGAPECTYCPICRTVHVIRGLSPEVKAHLTVAATSLAQAVTALMAPPAPVHEQGAPAGEKIDLDDNWSDDEETPH